MGLKLSILFTVIILSSIFPVNITIKSNIMQIGDLFEKPFFYFGYL